MLERLTAEGFRSQHDLGMAALRSLPIETQRHAASSFATLQAALLPFLRGFAQRGEVVTEEAVREFFAQQQAAAP